MTRSPKTLQEAIIYFADDQVSFDYIRTLRWPNGITCPFCDCDKHSFISTRRLWKCKGCKKQFSVKVGTIFEDSPIKLGTWLSAIWLIANAKNGISSHEVGRALGVTQKTAWFMLHRIRLAMKSGSFKKLGGEVEVDETFVGGKRGNMHRSKQHKVPIGSHNGKVAVIGMLERGGEFRAAVIPDVKTRSLMPHILDNVEPGTRLYTDASNSYNRLSHVPGYFSHSVIDHEVAYADGDNHVNGVENYWSLFKRCVKGTWVHVDRQHLNSYLDEQSFRFNQRKTNDGERFRMTASQVAGKRLTYEDLIGRA